ncbi:MAG: DUF169 domain-containing protein [Nitrososphaerales archaeon]
MLKTSVLYECAERIEKQIRVKTYPLAIKLLKSEDEIPKEAKRPKRDFGYCLSLCQAFSISRREGITIAMMKEDMWCPEPVIGYGLAEPPQYFLDGYNRFPDNVESLEAGARWAREFPRFKVGEYIGIVSTPLMKVEFEPDVVIVYCDSAQLTRLMLAAAYRDGRDFLCRLSPHAACVYSVVIAVQNGDYQITVPCMGDRRRAIAQDDEMIFSIPKKKLNDFIIGLRAAHKLNMNIPFGFTMMPQYKMPESYAKIARLMGMKKADESEID